MNITGGVSQSNKNLYVDGRSLGNEGAGASKQGVQLKSGQTIQGSVVSITDTPEGKMASINVGDSVISARLQDGMGLREGQVLNFAVRSSSGSSATITPLFENTSADQSTLRALAAAGLEINNDNIQMIKEMMRAQLPINKMAVLDMSRNLQSFPNNSIQTMVEMKSLGIPINAANLEQFESYKSYEHQVTTAMESIMDELPGAFNTLMEQGNQTRALNLYGSVLKLFGSEDMAANASDAAPEIIDAGGENKGTVLGQPEIIDAAKGEAAKEAGLKNNPEIISLNDNAEAKTDSATTAKVIISADDFPEGAAASGDGKENTGRIITQDGAETKAYGEILKPSGDGTQSTGKLQEDTFAAPRPLDRGFVNTLKNLGISDEAIRGYSDKPGSEAAQKQLLKELATSFESSDLSNPVESASWKKIFSSNDYNRLLKENISSQWHLKPDDVEKKENIENLYQRLGNQIKGLTSAINQNLGAETRLGQAANNLQNNLDFMNQLNQMFQYVQLPLQMAGQNVHGDLYVYKNKHKKMSEDGSVSAVLHLDMDNLGPVDVYVKMVDTRVSTNFYVADESVLDLIGENIHILNERLEKRGYTMNVTMKLHDEMEGQDAAVDEMLSVNKNQLLSTTSFDARA